ncbi:lamin tail domain-containing protein [Calditrichota bacterium]
MKIFFSIICCFLLLISAHLNAQSIIITEIMQNPTTSNDYDGEWFEVYNPGGSGVNINGWTIKDNGSNTHTINNGGSLTVPVGGFLVLGRVGNTSTNGGVPLDYVYGTSITLNNTSDALILENVSLDEIDRVEWDNGATFPNPDGASMVFTGLPSGENNNGLNWTTAIAREPNFIGTSGDLGSPGTNGSDQSLPVQLVSFTAHGSEGKVMLKWITESEVDNQGFYLYRSYEKEDNYEPLSDLIQGAGNSSARNVYSYIDRAVFNGLTYWYKLIDVDINGVRTEHQVISAIPHVSSVEIGVDNGSEAPEKFALKDNYPNPFNPETTIGFDIPELENELVNIDLSVYDMLGKKVKTLINEPLGPNSYNVKWNGTNDYGRLVPSGVYFYLLKSESFIKSNKMILIR